ncbi:MAG: hypothetical protein HQK58_17350 [Deltaproteobacteria bacterium]|nr:hypothetical protein [Deltaproteobacteria bacterium]
MLNCDLSETVAGQELIQETLKKGLELGIEKGIEKGKRENSQELILDVLTTRFGRVPRGVSGRIKQVDSQELLMELFRLAVTTDKLENFKTRLKEISDKS